MSSILGRSATADQRRVRKTQRPNLECYYYSTKRPSDRQPGISHERCQGELGGSSAVVISMSTTSPPSGLTTTSSSNPFTSSWIGRSKGAHSFGFTRECAFHSCSQLPRSYMILTTTFGRSDLSTRAERSRRLCEIVLTLFDGLYGFSV